MTFNSFYTRQAQEDALVTQITNPNRVGSGFINLGPQKRFASSTANWQTSGSMPPQPLTDILNAPRPSSDGLQPPPATHQTAHPTSKVVTSDKVAALASQLTCMTKAAVPMTADQQRALHSRAERADVPAAVPAEAVAAVAAQLAEDEVLARQLQQQMLQHAPPEPVAALAEQTFDHRAEQRADAANLVAPASKTPAPPETTTGDATGDATSKRIRALRKKVRDIDLLEERQREGAILQHDQLDKIAGKAAIVKELGELACDTIEKEQGALTGDATSKQIRALRKKVRDIDLLEERQREGAILQQNQLNKIAGKAAIVKELGALLL